MFQRYLLFWLIALSAVALYWPALPSATLAGRFDPFLMTDEYRLLSPLFAVTMFAIGCTLPRDEFRQVLDRWPTVLSGTAIQYTVMPLAAWTAAKLCDLPAELEIGVIMVGCVPGAMASNVLTLAARGNVSYSVSLTTSATLLSPVVVPLLLLLTLGTRTGPEPLEVFVKLLWTVVGPVLAGHWLCRRFPHLERRARRRAPAVANATILWIIATVVGLNREQLGETTAVVAAVLLAINLAGYTAGWMGGRLLGLPAGMRRALTLEVGMQNAGLGSVLVLDFFRESPAAAIPTAAYTFGCMLTGTMLAQAWGRRPDDRE